MVACNEDLNQKKISVFVILMSSYYTKINLEQSSLLSKKVSLINFILTIRTFLSL